MSTVTTNNIDLRARHASNVRQSLTMLQRLLLAVIVWETPFQIDTYLFFQDKWADVGAIGGLNISITTICLAALYLDWLIGFGTNIEPSTGRRVEWCPPLLLYVGCALASFLVADNRALALNAIALLVQSYLAYVYVANRVRTHDDIRFILVAMLTALLMQGLLIVGLYVTGQSFSLGPISAVIWPDQRVGSTFGSPNGAAAYLSLLIAPALAGLTNSDTRAMRLLAGGAMLFGCLGLVLTLSRGGWIAVGISVLLYLAIAWCWGRISIWVPACLLLTSALMGGLLYSNIADRLMNDDEGSAHSRVPLAKIAWKMIGDHPALGVGVNNSAVVGSKYALAPEFRHEWFYTTHNKYLLEWEELGLLGLLAFVWFLLTTLRTGWRAWRCQDAMLSPVALGLAVAILGQMTHMMVDTFNDRPSIQSLWLSAALIAAIFHVQQEAERGT